MGRRGRPRKAGRRFPGGKVKPVKPPSPREVAASMPHRRGLGEGVLSQLAENELGRLVLRGDLVGELALAGDYYAARWRGYVSTLGAPARLSGGHGRVVDCGGCLGLVETDFCMCALRRKLWFECQDALLRDAGRAGPIVFAVAVNNVGCTTGALPHLRLALTVLAQHFGLTPRAKGITDMPSSKLTPFSRPAGAV